jgi:hypothetical protein
MGITGQDAETLLDIEPSNTTGVRHVQPRP